MAVVAHRAGQPGFQDCDRLQPTGCVSCLYAALPDKQRSHGAKGCVIVLMPALCGGSRIKPSMLSGVQKMCSGFRAERMRSAGDAASVVVRCSSRGGAGRASLLPLGLCQAAIEACVSSLRLLQEHKTLLPMRSIILYSSGAATLEPLPGPPRSAADTIGAAAVLGVMKCLPYELPSLSVAPVDVDSADGSARSKGHAFVAASGSLTSR